MLEIKFRNLFRKTLLDLLRPDKITSRNSAVYIQYNTKKKTTQMSERRMNNHC